MKLRSYRRQPERTLELLLPAFADDGHHASPVHPFADATGLDDQLHRRQVVREAIAQLPDSHREILILRCVEELNTQETADLLEISTTAVKLRLHRAHQALRSLLAEHFEVTSDL